MPVVSKTTSGAERSSPRAVQETAETERRHAGSARGNWRIDLRFRVIRWRAPNSYAASRW